MLYIRSISLAIVALATTIFASPSTVVNVRIEGKNRTIFEGPVYTTVHTVHTTLGGTHYCNGTNNNQNPKPGPTCTGALDDAAKLHGFSFDGTYSTKYHDFMITSIGGELSTSTQFWALALNFKFAEVGGCQQQVQQNDEVLWAFYGSTTKHFLKLTGPKTALVNTPTTFVVTDGDTGQEVQGATVHGQTTDSDGRVAVTFAKVGVNSVKAEKSDSIRSNRVEVRVAYPGNSFRQAPLVS